MRQKTYPERIRTALHHVIAKTAANLSICAKTPGKDFSRIRKLPLQTMLLMLIGMGGGSLVKELYDWFGCSASTATVSAFVQQRDKIRPEALETIFHEFTTTTAPEILFRGYRLLAVDGSDLRLPSNPNDTFSSIKNAEGEKHYNLVHLNAMYDLMSKVYVDAAMQGKKGMNEHRALVSMVDRSTIRGKVIVLMDRGYESFNNIAHLQEKLWNFVIRAKESYGIISNLRLPDTPEFDVNITLTLTRRQTKETLALINGHPERYRWIQPHTTFDYIQPKHSDLYDLHFRVVRFSISDGIYETVYTNLSEQDFPAEKIKELYRLRWGIETSFRELKYAVGLASLHSKKKDSMLQEVFSRLILYNYASIIACHITIPKGKRINFSSAMYLCRQFLKRKVTSSQLFETLPKYLSPIRPGRQFKRYQNPISAVGFQYRFS
ncbi:MAG: IS4 family transposase [Roseburia sp.]